MVIQSAKGRPLWPQGFDPLNVDRVDGALIHTRFLKLGNDAGQMTAIDEDGADVEARTEGIGPHPIFNGVSWVEVVLSVRPTVTRTAGTLIIKGPGFTAEFRNATLDESRPADPRAIERASTGEVTPTGPSRGERMSARDESGWVDLGPVEELKRTPLRQVVLGRTRIALSWQDGRFGAVSGVCNHAGGPLGDGTLDGDISSAPGTTTSTTGPPARASRASRPTACPGTNCREEGGRLLVNLTPATTRNKPPHERHPLERPVVREPGPIRLLGLSTTAMDPAFPRYSTSDALLEIALAHGATLGAETKLLKANALRVRNCEGYYSKSAHACTWPCSITQMDPEDQMAAGVRGAGLLGRRGHPLLAHSVGQRQLALFQADRADELHPEPGHDP